MRTIFLILLLIILNVPTSTKAQFNKDQARISSCFRSNGHIKEFTIVDRQVSLSDRKTVYTYNSEGLLYNKILYRTNEYSEWIGIQKYEYEYNNGKLINIVYTKWNEKTSAWSTKAEHLVHIYDIDGDLLAIKHIHIDNNFNFIAEK